MGQSSDRKEERQERVENVFFNIGRENIYDSSYFALSTNVSNSGVCIYTNRPIEQGQVLSLFSKYLWNSLKHAEVKWVKHISQNICKAGLSII
jgi:hypothetical protein